MITAWTAWFLGSILVFAILESYALKTGRLTLSRYTYDIGAHWPLFLVLWGMVTGGLAVHFFWHWCPPGSVSGG